MVNYDLASCSNECGSVASVDDLHAGLEGEVVQLLPSLVLSEPAARVWVLLSPFTMHGMLLDVHQFRRSTRFWGISGLVIFQYHLSLIHI